jgi:hypothetical protein
VKFAASDERVHERPGPAENPADLVNGQQRLNGRRRLRCVLCCHVRNRADATSSLPHQFVVSAPDARLAQRVRESREALGLKQRGLAEKLHDCGWWLANQQLVSNVERERKRLSATEARIFALALNVDPDWLVHGLGVPQEPVKIEGVTAESVADGRPGSA